VLSSFRHLAIAQQVNEIAKDATQATIRESELTGITQKAIPARTAQAQK
jgi:hypothetical protein